MDRELVSTSRFLSLVLRHHPEKIGIWLDEQGWVDIDDLLAAATRSGRQLTRPLLERVVRENDKQRFAISADRRRIRANQGHSVEVDLGRLTVEARQTAVVEEAQPRCCSTALSTAFSIPSACPGSSGEVVNTFIYRRMWKRPARSDNVADIR